MLDTVSPTRSDSSIRPTHGAYESPCRSRQMMATRHDDNSSRGIKNNPINNTDPTGLRTVKPYETLPALTSAVTGFGRGGVDLLGNNPSLNNISLTGPRLPSLTTLSRAPSAPAGGSIAGAAIYNSVVHGPAVARTAIEAGLAIAGAGISLVVRGGNAESRPTRAIDLMRDFNQSTGIYQRQADAAKNIRPVLEETQGVIADVLAPGVQTTARVGFGHDPVRDVDVGAGARVVEGTLAALPVLGAFADDAGRFVKGIFSQVDTGAEGIGGVSHTATPHAPTNLSNPKFGLEVHEKFEKALLEQTGTRKGEWIIRTKPGQTGVDAEYIGRKNLGFKFAELKPRSPNGLNEFNGQVDRWQQSGQIKPGENTSLWFYSEQGVIGQSHITR